MMNTNRYFRWDWPAALLLIAIVFTSAVRLENTNWTSDLSYVGTFGVLGSILGLALGISQFQKRTMNWLVAGYTFVIIPLHLSNIITGEKMALGKLASFVGRLAVSFAYLFGGKAIEDHLFFVTLMSILFWSIGIYTGYRLIRQPAVLPVLLPSIIPILIVQYYDGRNVGRIWGLAVYFFIALILIGRMNLLSSKERWEQRQVMAGSEPEFDLNKNIVIAAAMIIMAAWILPTPQVILPEAARAWRNITQPFENARQRINDALAALHGNSYTEPSELYGDTMGLGHSAATGKDEIFSARAPKNNLPRLYWRVRVYDTYQDGSWKTSSSQNTPFDPDQGSLMRAGIMPSPAGEFTFSWNTSKSALLVTPSIPIWTSRTGSIQIAGSKEKGELDPLNWSVSPSLQTGDQYQVRALLLNPTRKDLRNAGITYPDWVTQRYLQVPTSIKPEITQLAEQITGAEKNAFDKAEAITDYLRQNMVYSETIPAPPTGADPVTWFLFSYKNGFCNYYASSEVLLLRSVGIPARLVVGYAQGKGDGYGKYSVHGQDAHAWPEVYFPDVGWVEFEPTVSQFAIVRPSGDAPILSENDAERIADRKRLEEEKLRNREPDNVEIASQTQKLIFLGLRQDQWLWIIISVTIVAVVGFSTWQLEKRKSFLEKAPRVIRTIYLRYNVKSPAWLDRWVRWSEVTAIERAFHSVNQSLSWLRKPQPDHLTPTERAQYLKSLIPQASSDIDYLTTALEQTLYTSHPAETADAFRAGWRIRIATLRKILLPASMENRS
jgi:transglutaminase-like putative cysteine protease